MKIRHRLRYLLGRRRLDRELAEELRIHEDNRNVTFSKTMPPFATVKSGACGRSSTPRWSAFRRTISSISLALR